MDVVLLSLDVAKELFYHFFGDFTRHATELDEHFYVVLVENPADVVADAAELLLHEGLVLSKGHAVDVHEAGSNVLAILLVHETLGLVFALKEDRSLTSSAAAFELTDADRLSHPLVAFTEGLNLLHFHSPWHASKLDGNHIVTRNCKLNKTNS